MRKFKRILCVVMTAVLLISIVPFALAEDGDGGSEYLVARKIGTDIGLSMPMVSNTAFEMGDSVYDMNGKLVYSLSENEILLALTDKYFVIEGDDGCRIISLATDKREAGELIGTYDLVSVPEIDGYTAVIGDDYGYCGFINPEGDLIKRLDYDYVYYLGEGMGVVTEAETGLCALFDVNSSKLITDYVYEDIGPMIGGIAPVAVSSKYGYIDSKGNALCDFEYDFVDVAVNGLICLYTEDGVRCVDLQGKTLFSGDYLMVFALGEFLFAVPSDVVNVGNEEIGNIDIDIYNKEGTLVLSLPLDEFFMF